MQTRRFAGLFSVLGVSICTLSAGCQSDAVSKDRNSTFLTSDDMVKMTDEMAASITSDPDVARVLAQKPMVIVMQPIDNRSNEVIRQGDLQLYVHRVRVLLSKEQALREKYVFVLNKADYEALEKQGLTAAQLGGPENLVHPEYSLSGTFYAATNVDLQRRSDTYLCTFKLTNLSSGIELWEGSYMTSKNIKKSILD